MQLEDWLDDLCVRFIINLPPEELASVERICFQVEEAQWFYEDFIRPLDPSLPSLSLKQFSLRIFQHCPLFSQWSAQHHMTAFAEFLAYKQRVPVRGAIMLSEAMDEVVLVKGWKKGANWSFPRGKINKDENDLDCAIREVYEETGFDIQAAGLVKPEKEMKYIEVTMREQHMRLYVFRGVPKDTHFEPRTRKEISKIEWYKLHDLPTLKKKAHHEHDDQPAINANKFYMVAPFLHPLKKWISQQRKREGKQGSSSLAVPPVLAEESATEQEDLLLYKQFSPPALSNLPEVLPGQQVYANQDPSAHLKELLNIGTTDKTMQQVSQLSNQQSHFPGPEANKSNALLALLRGQSDTPAQAHSQSSMHQSEQSLSYGQMTDIHPKIQPQSVLPLSQHNVHQLFSNVTQAADAHASQSQPPPYQQTGDPQFTRENLDGTQPSRIPPANALPKLTHHTRALLDAFQNRGTIDRSPEVTQPKIQSQIAAQQQTLLDVFKRTTPARNPDPATAVSQSAQSLSSLTELPGQNLHILQPLNPAPPPQTTNLLELFKRPAENGSAVSTRSPQTQQETPAELAAAPVESPRPVATSSQDDFLAALFKKDKPVRQRSPVPKEGQTGATISGPLNQPNLEKIARHPPTPEQSLKRSPVPTNRVLYDPKQPAQVKILARPESKQQQPRSPRITKSQPIAASKKQAKPQEKPFQPQILRRPPPSESRQSLTPSPSSGPISTTLQPSNIATSQSSRRVSEQSDSHKQSLLQLFGGTTPAPTQTQKLTKPISPRPVSPQSHMVSPITDDPISTRSRVGSLASIVSGPNPTEMQTQNRPKVEKRQTAAEDKAFLLNYLGKFAQES